MQVAKKRPTGRWYYVITIASVGLLASAPFFHAGSILRRRELRTRGAVYASLAVLAMVVMQTAPVDAEGSPQGIGTDLTVVALIGLAIAA